MTPDRQLAPRGALLVVVMGGMVVVLGAANGAAADSRGACVETSATSAPTSAPLALDADRAAWVAGTWFLRDDGDPSRRAGGSPAWCENGDEPQCDTGGEAPARDERVNSTDIGVALSELPSLTLAVYSEEAGHPPVVASGGAVGTHRELERPPRLG